MAFRLPFPPVGEQREPRPGEAGAGQREPPPGMEFLNGIFTRGFWSKILVFSDSSFCIVFYPFPFYKMIFLVLQIFFASIFKTSAEYRVWFSFKNPSVETL
jgi:hypothetical protein